MNTNWLFGGQYMAGSESIPYDDSDFAPSPAAYRHPLSWQNWDYQAWQQLWIYRRHFNGAPLLDPHRPGTGSSSTSTASWSTRRCVNDQAVRQPSGRIPALLGRTHGKVTAGHNLLSVIVDSRCLAVPPVGIGRGPDSIDFFQPGGIYRDVSLRVVPQVFLSDLYANRSTCSARSRAWTSSAPSTRPRRRTDGTLLVELLDGRHQIAARAKHGQGHLAGTSTVKLGLTGLGAVSLWSPDSPHLYKVRATLSFPGVGSHA